MIEVLKDREFIVRAEVTAVENEGKLAGGFRARKASDRSGREGNGHESSEFLDVVEDADRSVCWLLLRQLVTRN
jgi:hypothetical protein